MSVKYLPFPLKHTPNIMTISYNIRATCHRDRDSGSREELAWSHTVQPGSQQAQPERLSPGPEHRAMLSSKVPSETSGKRPAEPRGQRLPTLMGVLAFPQLLEPSVKGNQAFKKTYYESQELNSKEHRMRM